MRGEPNVAARGCRPVAQRAAIYAALKPKGVVESGLLRFGADGETGRGLGSDHYPVLRWTPTALLSGSATTLGAGQISMANSARRCARRTMASSSQ